MKKLLGGAGGGGGGSARTPVIRDDTLFSRDILEFTLGLAEGPIGGLVRGPKSFYADDTPVMSAEGALNFTPFNIHMYHGGAPASNIRNVLGGTGSSSQVGVNLATNTPVVRSTPANLRNQIDVIEVRLNIQSLYQAHTNGDQLENTARFRLQYRQAGTSNWTNFNGQDVLEIHGKTTSGYVREFRIGVPRINNDWEIRVEKLNSDVSTENICVMSWESFQSVTQEERRYDNLAVIRGLAQASDQFSNLPTFTGVYALMLVRVPSNYDPVTRYYNGPWDGTFKLAHTDNPAWVLYDLAMNTRYGFKAYLPQLQADRFSFYEFSKWCDTMVPRHGASGYEPRYTFNYFFDSQANARDVVAEMCAKFGVLVLVNNANTVYVKPDQPANPVQLFGPESIIKDSIQYQFSDPATRVNDVNVQFMNPNLGFNVDFRRIHNQSLIDKQGRIPTELDCRDCLSVYEAERRAAMRLLTSNTEITTISFQTTRAAIKLDIFDLIAVTDPMVGHGVSGRILSRQGNTITLRDQIFVPANVDLTMSLQTPDGVKTLLVRAANPSTTTLTLADGQVWPTRVPDRAQFSLGHTQLGLPKLYRIMTIAEDQANPDLYTITALEHNPNKYNDVFELAAATISTSAFIGRKTPNRPQFEVISSGPEHMRLLTDGRIQQRIFVRLVEDPLDQLSHSILSYRRIGYDDWQQVMVYGSYVYVNDVNPGEVYEFAAKGVNTQGRTSASSVIQTHTVAAAVRRPDAPAGLSATAEGNNIRLRITPPADPSTVVNYEIRVGTNWDTARVLGFTPGLEFLHVDVDDLRFQYLVKSHNALAPSVGVAQLDFTLPNNLTAPGDWKAAGGYGEIILSGPPVSDVRFHAFVIYGATAASATPILLGTSASTSYNHRVASDTTLTRYSVAWKTRAGVESPRTPWVAATPLGDDLVEEVRNIADGVLADANELLDGAREDLDQKVTAATNAAGNAEAARAAAAAAAADAETARAAAVQQAANALASANAATAAKTAAETAQGAAQTAKTAAETAKTASETARTQAQTAQAAAEAARTTAASSATAAGAAKDAAELARTQAQTAATNAAGSASAASGSASTAGTKATEAGQSATAAAASAVTAGNYATNAGNSASAAATSASAASTSQSAAAQSATAASGSATTAATKAGEASTSASQAATSATNAQGSANSASTSASTSATTLVSMRQLINGIQPTIIARGTEAQRAFGTSMGGHPDSYPNSAYLTGDYLVDETHGPFIRRQQQTSRLRYVTVAAFPVSMTTFQVKLRARMNTNTPRAVELQIGSLSATGSEIRRATVRTITPGDGEVFTITMIVGTTTGGMQDAVLAANMQTGAYYRVGIDLPGVAFVNGVVPTFDIFDVEVTDLTEADKAFRSANQAETAANAAVTSAATATTQATNATQAAAAATTAKTAAETARGQAQTAATSAATSETNALASANAASTSATTAAKSQGYAEGIANGSLVRKGVFEDGERGLWGTGTIVNVPVAHPLGRTKALRLNVQDNIEAINIDLTNNAYQGNLHNRTLKVSGYVLVVKGTFRAGFWRRRPNGSTPLYVYDAYLPTGTSATQWVYYEGEVSTGTTYPDVVRYAPWLKVEQDSQGAREVYVTDVRVEDITESKLASGSAEAATTAATNAQTSATAAGQSASAAATSATSAQTSAGNASTSASQAASSATTAQGSANSASTSATTAATAATGAALSLIETHPTRLSTGLNNFRGELTGPPDRFELTTDGANTVARNTVQNGAGVISWGRAVPLDPTHTYKIWLIARRVSGEGRVNLRFVYTNNELGSIRVGFRDVGYTQTVFPLDGEYVRIETELVPAQVTPSNGTLTGATHIRPALVINQNNQAGTVYHILAFGLEDVTAAAAAAQSASAAATSASQAAASQTAAGQSASAAATSATSAQTAAGNASTSASQAATSATNAQGSANSAATSATTAATARDTTLQGMAMRGGIPPMAITDDMRNFTTAASQAVGLPLANRSGLSVVTNPDGLPALRHIFTGMTVENAVVSNERMHVTGRFIRFKFKFRAGIALPAGGRYQAQWRVQHFNSPLEADTNVVTSGSTGTLGFMPGDDLDTVYSLEVYFGPATETRAGYRVQALPNPDRPWCRFGLKWYARDVTVSANKALDLFDFELEDVTEMILAKEQAMAAATSATSASASQTAAEQSATAAANSATSAQTSAGNASTSASQAATSATNASGSANSAATSATTAANAGQAAFKTAVAMLPSTFINDGEYFTSQITGSQEDRLNTSLSSQAPVVSTDQGPAAQITPGSTNVLVSLKQYLRMIPGNRYRLTIRARHVGPFGTNTRQIVRGVVRLMTEEGVHISSVSDIVSFQESFTAIDTWQDLKAEWTAPATPSTLAVVLAYFDGARRATLPAGSTAQIARVMVEDITLATAAANSAAAAATSATSASASQSAAAQSATAAANSATTATTKAGEASTSASQAATSATNAAGSATSASTSATTAATASRAAVLQDGNFSFDNGYVGWNHNVLGTSDSVANTTLHAEWEGMSNVLVSNPGIRLNLFSQRVFELVPGRQYHVATRFKVKGTTGVNCRMYVGVRGVKADGSLSGTNNSYVCINGLRYRDEQGIQQTGLDRGVFTLASLPEDTVGVKLMIFGNYDTDPAIQVGIDYLRLEDITESYQAGISATAAATSATSATASQTAAAQSATAAATSATSASTSAGNASTSATQAAASATNASGSANSAQTSASTAATAAQTSLLTAVEMMPSTMEGRGKYFVDSLIGSPSARAEMTLPSWATEVNTDQGPTLQVGNGSTNVHISPKQHLVMAPGRRYRMTIRARHVGAFGTLSATGLSGVVRRLTETYAALTPTTDIATTRFTFSAIDTWQDFSVEWNAPTSGSMIVCLIPYLIGASRTTLPANSFYQIARVLVEDITQTTAAAASATAAATSATQAAASQTAAGQSATAAANSATTAQTQAGNASTSASQAATSATNASGSANSAATSATNAAKSQLYAQSAFEGNMVRKGVFEDGDKGFWNAGTVVDVPVAHPLGRTKALRLTVQDNIEANNNRLTQNSYVGSLHNRVLKVSGYMLTLAGQGRLGFWRSRPNGSSPLNHYNSYLPPNQSATEWIFFEGEVSTGTAYPDATNYAPWVQVTVGSGTTREVFVTDLRIIDITEQKAAEASANAASTSESNAASSATLAEQQASAATTAKNLAETARGAAQTSQTAAATSATNAANSASQASTSATTAATAATQAGNSATAAQTSASTASTSASTATSKAAEATTAATNASKLLTQGAAGNPAFQLWSSTNPDGMNVGTGTNNSIAKATGTNAKYTNAMTMVAGGTSDGPYLRLDRSSNSLKISVSPKAIKVTMEIEYLSGNIDNGGGLTASWIGTATTTAVKLLKDMISATTGVIHLVEFILERPATTNVSTATNFRLDFYVARGSTRKAAQIRVHSFDFQEIVAGSLTEITQRTTALIDGSAGALMTLRAQAGSNGALLELVSLADPNGTSQSQARISADKILLDGSVTAAQMNVGYLQGGRLKSNFLDVDTLLTIESGAGLRYAKNHQHDDGTDGLYFGADTSGNFGFTASRTNGSNGRRQSLKITKETGLQLFNGRHYVSGQSVPENHQLTHYVDRWNLPLGSTELSLTLYGGGGSGLWWGTDPVSGGTTRYSGNWGGSTRVSLYNGNTHITDFWADGGQPGDVHSGHVNGESSHFGPGGYSPPSYYEDGLLIIPNGHDSPSLSAGGAGIHGGGGGYRGQVRTYWASLAGMAEPWIQVAPGGGGPRPTGNGNLQKSGGAGGGGAVQFFTRRPQDLPADVVPLVPSAVGNFSKNGHWFGFPDHGAGLWTIAEHGEAELGFGWINIGEGVSIHIMRDTCVTFISQRTPYWEGGGYNTQRNMRYTFHAMGSWG